MSLFGVIIWVGLVAIGLLIAGLGAGLETGVYSLNRVRFRVLQHQTNRSARLLAPYVAAPSALIATLLIAHNAGVKLATHAVAVLLHERDLTQWQVVSFDVLIIMPLLFVFAETLPKDLFTIHADRLLLPFARSIVGLIHLLRYTGVLPLMTGASQLIMWLLGIQYQAESLHPRREVETLVREGVGHGVVSDEQLEIVERVLALGGRCVADVMIPWEKVIKMGIDDPAAVLWELVSTSKQSRFPVVDGEGRVQGLVNVFDALVYEKDQCPSVDVLMIPAETFVEDMPLRDALSQLQQRRCAMAVVENRQNRSVGIVTIKDLLEPITGELENW